MQYQGQPITLDNYRTLFSGYPDDLLDEVRSGILDSVPIHTFLGKCLDSWHLHEVRLAMKDTVPPKYYRLPGPILNKVRELYCGGVSLEPIDRYLKEEFTSDTWELILFCLESGQVMENYDFTKLPVGMELPIYSGVANGIDMSSFLTGQQYSLQYIKDTVTISTRFGIKIDTLLAKGFSESVLGILKSLRYLESFQKLVALVTPRMSTDEVEILADLLEAGFPYLEEVTRTDSEGYLVYMAFQLGRIFEAYQEKLNYRPLLDPNLGIAQINSLVMESRYENANRFRGSFRKGTH